MALYKNILMPTDGSVHSKAAIAHGLELAKVHDAEVTVLSVIDVSDVTSTLQGVSPGPYNASIQGDMAEAAVKEAADMAIKAGVKVKAFVKIGRPAADIIEMSSNFDLIVMGTQGRTGLPHLLIGSVTERVVREARCPVLVTKCKRA